MRYFVDVQGTLIDDIDKNPIKGSIQFINELNSENIPYMVVTNNTKEESFKFLEYLNSIGFQISKERYLDPLMILDEILESKEILAFGTPTFIETLQKRGFETSSKNPKYLLLGVKHDYTFEEYSQIIETLLQNRDCKLIGMHGTSIYSKKGKRYPGVGAILEMIKFATGRNYEIVGKPSQLFYKKALQLLGEDDFSKVTMISDDLKGDLAGAKELGMRTVFVLSGKIKNIDEITPFLENEKPDQIFNLIGEIKI